MIEGFKKLPLWLQIVIIAAIAYGIYRAYIYFTVTRPQNANYNATVKNAQTALAQLSQQGVHPTQGEAAYNGMANALQTTFTGCGLDWVGVVVPTFQQMKNDADVYALIQNYGVRTFDECGWGSFTGDLASALAYKTGGVILTVTANPFTDASISSINKILEQNGLSYRF